MAFLSGIGRARHIPTRTDTVVRFAPEHVVLFLCLCNLGSKEMPQGYYSKWRSSKLCLTLYGYASIVDKDRYDS